MSLSFSNQYKKQINKARASYIRERSLRKEYYNKIYNISINKTKINANEATEISKSHKELGTLMKGIHIVASPKRVNIEDVIGNQLNNPNSFTQNPSKKLTQLDEILSNVNNCNSNENIINHEKLFYYSNSNEIMTVQQFINVFKSTESQRSDKEKFRKHLKIQDAREKIMQIQQEKHDAYQTRKRPFSSSLYGSHKMSPKSDLYDLSPVFNNELLRNKIQKPNIDLDTNIDFTQSTTNDMKSTHDNTIKKSGIFHANDSVVDSQNRLLFVQGSNKNQISSRSRRKMEEIMANMNPNERNEGLTEKSLPQNLQKKANKIDFGAKFTEREIMNQLIHLNVSPRHSTIDEAMINTMKERRIQNMFKDHRVMDRIIEKSTQINDSKEGMILASPKEAMKFYFLNSLTGTQIPQHNTTHIKVCQNEDEKKTQNINIQIQNNIKNIESILQSPGSSRSLNKRSGNLLRPSYTSPSKFMSKEDHSTKEKEIKIEESDSIRNVSIANIFNIQSPSDKTRDISPQNPSTIGSSIKISKKDTQKINQSIVELYDIRENWRVSPKSANNLSNLLISTHSPKIIREPMVGKDPLLSKRIPLRIEISKKYNIVKKVNSNKVLGKEMSNAVDELRNKMNNEVLVKNRDYVDLFI